MEINIAGRIIQAIAFFIYINFMCMAPFGIILGPIMIVSGFIGNVKADTGPWLILLGLLYIILSVFFIYCLRKDIDIPEIFDNWLTRNFGSPIPDDSSSKKEPVFKKSNTNNNNNLPKPSISAYKTTFNEYVNKETGKIIKENNLTNTADKKAAELVAINNIQHSPEKISKIFNTTVNRAKEIEESISIEEEKKIANHISYEGRISIKDKNKMKALLGYKCAACGKDMSEIYGDLGHNYIELHHKIPYSDMKENEIRTLTENEFCVLCPDCHRMIHKLPDASDIDLLTRIIKLNKNN